MSLDHRISDEKVNHSSSDEKVDLREFETTPGQERLKIVNYVSEAKKITRANNGSFSTFL